MVVLDRQQIGLPGLKPSSGGTGLTLWAMPVAAGVVGDLDFITGVATQYMSPQRRAAALFDGGHHLELTQAQVTVLRLPSSRPMGAEDVRDLEGGAPHRAALPRYRVFQWTDHLAQQVGGHLGGGGSWSQAYVPQDIDLTMSRSGLCPVRARRPDLRRAGGEFTGHCNPPCQAIPPAKENIVEISYESADARVRAIGGTSAEHLGSFIAWLSRQQYSAGYVCIVARHALAFVRWCERRGIEFDALTDDGIDRYQRSRARRRSRRPETRRQERQALQSLLLHFLREQGISAAAASCASRLLTALPQTSHNTCGVTRRWRRSRSTPIRG